MVSKARDDLPEPDSPVKTISLSLGSSRLTFRRLCSRAPRTTMTSDDTDVTLSREHTFGVGTPLVPVLLVFTVALLPTTAILGPDPATADPDRAAWLFSSDVPFLLLGVVGIVAARR